MNCSYESFLLNEPVDSVHKTNLNDSFTKMDSSGSCDLVIVVNSEDFNFYHMVEELKYSTRVLWTTFFYDGFTSFLKDFVFGMTCRWMNNDSILIFLRTIPLMLYHLSPKEKKYGCFFCFFCEVMWIISISLRFDSLGFVMKKGSWHVLCETSFLGRSMFSSLNDVCIPDHCRLI